MSWQYVNLVFIDWFATQWPKTLALTCFKVFLFSRNLSWKLLYICSALAAIHTFL